MNIKVKEKLFTKSNIIAVSHFLFTFFNDLIIYRLQNSQQNQYTTWFYWLGKFLIFILLLFVWKKILSIDIKEKETKKRIYIFWIYFCVLMTIQILVWPGIWRWDEMITLGNLTDGNVYYWQHWLSSLYQFIGMQLIPCPGGILIVQVIVISLIIGDIVYKLKYYLETKWTYLVYIPLLLPSVLDSNLYPIRATICAYIELWIVFQLLFICIFNEECTTKKIVLLGVLGGVMTSWRPENIIYIVGVPIMLLFMKNFDWKKAGIYLTISIIIICTSSKIQNAGLSSAVFIFNEDGSIIREKEAYPLSGMITALGEIVNSNFKSNTKDEDLNEIGKAIDLEIMREGGGMGAFWGGGLKDLSEENFNKVKKIYVKLVLYNFPQFLSSRVELFKEGNLKPNVATLLIASAHIYDDDRGVLSEDIWRTYNEFKTRYIFNKPINSDLRKTVISLLECKKTSDYYSSSTGLTMIFYNVLPILMILLLIWIIEAIRRKYIFFLLIGILLAKATIVFLTAPTPYFMYYFSTYLIGAIISVFWVIKERYAIKRCILRLTHGGKKIE